MSFRKQLLCRQKSCMAKCSPVRLHMLERQAGTVFETQKTIAEESLSVG